MKEKTVPVRRSGRTVYIPKSVAMRNRLRRSEKLRKARIKKVVAQVLEVFENDRMKALRWLKEEKLGQYGNKSRFDLLNKGRFRFIKRQLDVIKRNKQAEQVVDEVVNDK